MGKKTGANPTDRGKCGTKRSLLVDGEGMPLAVVIGPANRTDMKLLEETLAAVVVKRPTATAAQPQQLCGDKGYDYPECRAQAKAQGYTPHIRSRGEETRQREQHADAIPRRWVVEVTLGWLNRFRKLLVRFERLEVSHRALVQLGCAAIVWQHT